MKTIQKETIVPFRAKQLYDLVNDVRRYPEFISGCSRAQVLSSGEHEIRARLEFSLFGVRKSFSTVNRLSPPQMIELRLLEGPFRHLQGYWMFEDLASGRCKVTFSLNFEFDHFLVEKAFGPVFSTIVESLVERFQQRAQAIYGAIDAH